MRTAPADGQPPAGIALPHAASTAGYVGQATVVEQSRAAAEVQAAVIMAKRMPRSVPEAIAAMRETCQVMELAEHAFFRYSRGGGQITGPSVNLARELARCWGNMQYGITELERDTVNRQSVMLAFAWDLQTNTRSTTTFIVPWVRDKQGQTDASPLTSVRDQYENNANMGARRVREMVFAVLPKWFTEQGQTICRNTVEHGSTDPLPQRISRIIDAFDELGVHASQLVTKLGRAEGQWGTGDVATLTVIGKSIRVGETTVEDEFPVVDLKVTAAEITGRAQATPLKTAMKTAPSVDIGEQLPPDLSTDTTGNVARDAPDEDQVAQLSPQRRAKVAVDALLSAATADEAQKTQRTLGDVRDVAVPTARALGAPVVEALGLEVESITVGQLAHRVVAYVTKHGMSVREGADAA